MSGEATDSTQSAGRREFLRQGMLAGGGLVLCLVLPSVQSGSRAAGAPGPSQLNAWLRIGTDDSITILVDRSEMGQGVYTALPTLLAEELEVDLTTIRIVAAPVGDVYSNALNGGQITGTSNSVQDAWDKLRKAGAQARTVLISAAAQKWHVDPSSCRAENGHVLGPQGRRASYGQLAEVASRLPLPAGITLKNPAEFTLIGRALPRLDTPEKVDGSAVFGLDIQLPGMLYAVIALPPTLGAEVATVDAAAALSMPGVRKVLNTRSGVIVVAEHFWQAVKARERLQISWKPGAHAPGNSQAIRDLLQAAAAKPGASALGRQEVRPELKTGDTANALKRATKTISADYEVPLLAHATMEPMNCTADVGAGKCDVYVGTQVQQLTQAAAAQAAGLQPQQVAVHTTLLGGGFGRRLEVDFVPAAVEASKAVGAPVKLIWTREDDMTHDYYRPAVLSRVTAGVSDQGQLVAFDLHIASPSITARFDPTNTNPFDSVIEYAQNFPYAVANFELRFSRQEIGLDVGYMRSVSHGPNCFAIESAIDELAAVLKRDPLDFRLQLLAGKPRHLQVLRLAAERAGWGHRVPGRYYGIAFMEGYSSCIAQVAEVSVVDDAIRLHRVTCAIDCGQVVNSQIVTAQLESGIVYALSATYWGEITIENGRVQQQNFNHYRVLRLNEMPQIDVHLIPSTEPPGGIGETGFPPVAPAICNAIFAATGKRLRSLPISTHLAMTYK